ncbi:heterokaryon incompatibility protein [Diplodia corticola]|uniref:Heterokaryon incompatibility protein n=1 Tax=Diplodia corticola TaxID=236234 RepID=A0A1J9QPI8_9PEZI|nr:heterokaryon incompatibility protein [Diplodia corticola]OJD30377.1 heterokaryon incompatibility protein [Diplodia corticola]
MWGGLETPHGAPDLFIAHVTSTVIDLHFKSRPSNGTTAAHMHSPKMHAAFSESAALPVDLYEPALSWYFDTEEFDCWVKKDRTWHLRCVGGPGSGKTTLAALAFNNIRDRFARVPDVGVASVFVVADVYNDGEDAAAFVESVLSSLCRQFRRNSGETSRVSDGIYGAYVAACGRGDRFSRRIKLLRKALYARLLSLSHAFLIVDDFDRCGDAIELFFEDEFARLRRHGLKIFVTSRIAFQRSQLSVWCDAVNSEGEQCPSYGITVYWKCKQCLLRGAEEDYIICEACRLRGEGCGICGAGAAELYEPYSHLEVDLSITGELAAEFASWSLEAEHGDLGLDTSNENKPPRSALGRTLVNRGGPKVIQSLVNSIANDAFNNISFIKLRLDAIRTAHSVDAVLTVGDRLPGNRVAMFDAAIKRIAGQAQPQSRLGLTAISAAANHYNGRPFRDLERELHRVVPRDGARGSQPYSVQEVLKATAGFLTVDNSEDQLVLPYHESFFLYVTENYNELLVWTRGDLRYAMPPRSKTMAQMGARDEGKRAPPKGRVAPRVQLGHGKMKLARQGTTREMFCKYCRESVLESTQRWAYHHKTFRDLETSALAQEPCTFCRALHADVSSAAEPFDEPLYRWSITRPASIRETQDPVVITFRPCRPIKFATRDDHVREEFPPEREFYMFPDNDLTALASPATLGPSTNSPQSWAQVARWMHTCLTTHPRCARRASASGSSSSSSSSRHFVPTRLLDVQHPAYPSRIGLIETASHPAFASSTSSTTSSTPSCSTHPSAPPPPPPPPYCTLSHCWGPTPTFLRLRGHNIARFLRDGIPLADLHNTNFAHAIETCRRLGARYLWIDSLCIVQHWVEGVEAAPADAGERALEDADWRREAPCMHDVYRGSWCNIAAVDAGDAGGGLFRGGGVGEEEGGREAVVVPGTYRVEGEGAASVFGGRKGGTWRVVSGDMWQRELLGTPLYKRAWVFQERLLSPRLLHFTRHQLFWDCATLSACETFPHGLPPPLDAPAVSDRHWRALLLQQQTGPTSSHQSSHSQQPSSLAAAPMNSGSSLSLERFWASAVASYTRCALTRASDRAVAVWGVAKPLRDGGAGMLREAYAAGLWRRGLEEQLAWRLVETPKPTPEMLSSSSRCGAATAAAGGAGGGAGGNGGNGAAAVTTTPTPTPTPTSHHGEAAPAADFPSWSWMAVVDAAASAVEVADRLPGRRSYTVVAHDGASPVAFELADGFRGLADEEEGEGEAFGTWGEQFGAWDERMREVAAARGKEGREKEEKKKKKVTGVQPSRLGTVGEEEKEEEGGAPSVVGSGEEGENLMDQHPRLASNSIALYGHVGRARCVYDALREDYRLDIPGAAEDRCRVEVFPDFVIPHGAVVYFMILAATVEKNESDWEGEYDEDDEDGEYDGSDETEENEEEGHKIEHDGSVIEPEDADEAEDGSQGAVDEFDAPCQGVGIILQPAEEDNHFYRLGALRFEMTRAIMESTYIGVDSDDLTGCDEEKKFKIWLD